eukprot:jgi/Chlat1/46/ChrspC238589S00925
MDPIDAEISVNGTFIASGFASPAIDLTENGLTVLIIQVTNTGERRAIGTVEYVISVLRPKKSTQGRGVTAAGAIAAGVAVLAMYGLWWYTRREAESNRARKRYEDLQTMYGLLEESRRTADEENQAHS